MRKNISRLAACALAMPLALGAGGSWARTKITVGHAPMPDPTPLYVAKDQGYFDKRGLDVTLQIIRVSRVLPIVDSVASTSAGSRRFDSMQAQPMLHTPLKSADFIVP